MDVSKLPIFSKEELAQRNGKTMPAIWVAYKGAIYDVSTSELFEGGKHYEHQAGQDLTLEMGDAPHLDDVMCNFPIVGTLAGSTYAPPTHRPDGDVSSGTSKDEAQKNTANSLSSGFSSSSLFSSSQPTTSSFSSPLTESSIPPPSSFQQPIPSSSSGYSTPTTGVSVSSNEKKIKVVEIKKVKPDIRKIRFEYVSHDFTFKAGQYLKIDFGGEIGKRSYSMASHPSSKYLDLLIQNKSGGKATDYIFNELFLGDEFSISGPYSDFVLPDNTHQELCFICTDVGIAPIRSLLIDIVQKNKKYKKINLIYGNRFATDLLYEEELALFSELLPELSCFYTFSRESYLSKNMEKGYVHSIYERLYANRQQATFFVCGWERMVKEAKDRLSKLGYDKNNVITQLYI